MSGCSYHTNGKYTEYSQNSVYCETCTVLSVWRVALCEWLYSATKRVSWDQGPRTVTEEMFTEYMNRCFSQPTSESFQPWQKNGITQICLRPALQSPLLIVIPNPLCKLKHTWGHSSLTSPGSPLGLSQSF